MLANAAVSVLLRRLVPIVLLFSPAGGDAVRAQAADFGFRFEVGVCLTERLDTFSGMFIEELGGDRARTATARLSLTEPQMTAVYRAIEDIRFLDFPTTFQGVPAGTQEVTTIAPYRTYRLEVRNGGVVHAVVWNDDTKPTTAEADRLRELFSMMLGFIPRTSRVQTSPCSDGRLHVAHFSSATVGAPNDLQTGRLRNGRVGQPRGYRCNPLRRTTFC
jgi:hypothetical protein